MVIRVKIYSLTASASTDDNPTCQWISDEMLPRYIQGVAKKFHGEMKKLHEQKTTKKQNNTRSNVPSPSELST